MDAEVSSNFGHGAAFVDEPQTVELELTRLAVAGGRHQTFLQGTKYVPYRGVYKTDSIPTVPPHEYRSQGYKDSNQEPNMLRPQPRVWGRHTLRAKPSGCH
jgi:hypothetical protein